jgi:ubiquinone/menaquinone biosynthesis C-methylase UbiE
MKGDFLKPNEVLKKLKLKEDIIAADFGSGSGGWVIPLAEKLEDGKIYAIDILEEPLSALRAKAKLAKISNIQTILADVEKKTEIFEESCDLVLITNLLFQSDDKKKVLEEAKRVLKKGGRILVVDWKETAPLGPEEGRVSPEEVKETALDLNLRIENEFDAGPYHFGLVFTKN